MGLTSRDGIIPLYLRNDIGGPMARTVEDAVRILDVIVGYDEADPVTARSEGRMPESYLSFLDPEGLKGARFGVFRRYLDNPSIDPEIKDLTERAILELEERGAVVVNDFDVPDYEALTADIWCNTFQHDLNDYLSTLGDSAPFKNLENIVASGQYLPENERSLLNALEVALPPEERNPPCLDLYSTPKNNAFREAVLEAMDRDSIDAIIYPTWSNPPRLVGDLDSPAGDNSQVLSPQTGLPAITLPIGFTAAGLPAGMTFIGRLFGEPDLIRFVFAYEQATRHRRPPERFP